MSYALGCGNNAEASFFSLALFLCRHIMLKVTYKWDYGSHEENLDEKVVELLQDELQDGLALLHGQLYNVKGLYGNQP